MHKSGKFTEYSLGGSVENKKASPASGARASKSRNFLDIGDSIPHNPPHTERNTTRMATEAEKSDAVGNLTQALDYVAKAVEGVSHDPNLELLVRRMSVASNILGEVQALLAPEQKSSQPAYKVNP